MDELGQYQYQYVLHYKKVIQQKCWINEGILTNGQNYPTSIQHAWD